MAPTRSSSMLAGNCDAMIKPSVEMMPEASISADDPFNSIKIERISPYFFDGFDCLSFMVED